MQLSERILKIAQGEPLADEPGYLETVKSQNEETLGMQIDWREQPEVFLTVTIGNKNRPMMSVLKGKGGDYKLSVLAARDPETTGSLAIQQLTYFPDDPQPLLSELGGCPRYPEKFQQSLRDLRAAGCRCMPELPRAINVPEITERFLTWAHQQARLVEEDTPPDRFSDSLRQRLPQFFLPLEE